MTWPHCELIERLVKSQRPPSHSNGFFPSEPAKPAERPGAAAKDAEGDGRGRRVPPEAPAG